MNNNQFNVLIFTSLISILMILPELTLAQTVSKVLWQQGTGKYNNQYSRAVAFSKDGGETWSEIKHDFQIVESKCQASLLNFGEYKKKNLYLFSNPAVPVGRTAMSIKTSFNNCDSWSNSKLIFAGPSAYSCLVKLPNGQVGLFFEAGEKRPYEKMVFVSFKIKELFTPGTLIEEI